MTPLALTFPTSASEVGPVMMSVIFAAVVLGVVYGLYRLARHALQRRKK